MFYIYKPHGNHKSKTYNRYRHTQKDSKHKADDSHQITREQNKKGGGKKTYKNTPLKLKK